MRVETPPDLAAAIETELAAAGGSPRARSRALAELFRLFTAERARLGRHSYLDVPRLRAAYLSYHLPLNAARAAGVLRHVLQLRPGAAALEEVVDLGAGPGSAALATLFALPAARPRSYALHDRSRAALAVARRLLSRAAERLEAGGAPRPLAAVRTSVSRLPVVPRLPRRALVWMSMVLNELGVGFARGPRPEALLGPLAAALEPPSLVLVIEPALRLPGRNLLRFHDAAVASGKWRVLAPCTHQRRCPLLQAAGNSWCHFRLEWEPPAFAREVAAPLGLGREPPALAFLALERAAGGPPPRPERARVIGDPMAVRGRGRGIYLCQEGERRLAPPGDGGPERGDIVTVEGSGEIRREVAWE